MKNTFCRAAAALIAICVFSHAHAGESRAPAKTILCTTYPAYLFTRNITRGNSLVSVESLFPAEMGCPHDYALTPGDMAKIARADILVVNGLGMEEFLGRPVEQANPGIVVVDSSLGIRDIIMYDDDEDHHEEHRHGGAEEEGHEEEDHHDEAEEHVHGHDHDHAESGHRHDEGPNPHVFTSPAMSAQMVETIAGRLCLLDPAGAAVYAANGAEYAGVLRALEREMADAAGRFVNTRIVEPHGAFGYLARDLGLEIVASFQPHGQEISASEMLAVLDVIREEKPGVIVVEPQYPARAGETLAAETGLPVITLDPVATGIENPPADHYETVMRSNLEQLQKTLGGQ